MEDRDPSEAQTAVMVLLLAVKGVLDVGTDHWEKAAVDALAVVMIGGLSLWAVLRRKGGA